MRQNGVSASEMMQTVLITGAAGGIGTRLRQLLKGVYPDIRLSDVRRPADLAADESFIEADLASMAEVENAVSGVDGIIGARAHVSLAR